MATHSISLLGCRSRAELRPWLSYRPHPYQVVATIFWNWAQAVTASRRGQDNWWFRRNEDPYGRAAFDAQMEAYNLGSGALHALFRVQLVADSHELVGAARHAHHVTSELHRASTATELGERAHEAEEALEHFIVLASRDVQRHPARSGSG